MKLLLNFAILFTIFFLTNCKSKKAIISNEDKDYSTVFEQNRGDIRIMFYNCENYFDVYNDPEKNDDDFTPNGVKYWNWKKFNTKMWHISQVITNVGGWTPPEIVGLCEIENQYVLEQLVKVSPLKAFGYKIIHYESLDERGIDVGLLYIPSKFKPITSYPIRFSFPEPDSRPTRDILYAKGIIANGDTLHIFVNHWPSRLGGMLESEPKRMFVAQLLRQKVDSIFKMNSNSNIFIMGDLNDFPTNNSLLKGLNTKTDFSKIENNSLYNLSYYLQEVKGEFSHRFQGESGVLDQMIVSGSLLDTNNTIFTTKNDAHIFKADFLLVQDPNFVGYAPFRTYNGGTYLGGYSDHLPPYCDFYFKKK